jgi:GMP synthase (glutamine-hydrolysing)
MKTRGGHGFSVLVIQHVPAETPGLIGDVLDERGASLAIARVFAGDPVPAVAAPHDALVVMGGPMGVYEVARHPHLNEEIGLIRSAIAEGVPVLGVCLGSQLLAAALGSSAHPATKELGWRPVTLTPGGRADPVWADAPETFTVFHWHGDAFDPPPGSTSLAFSALTPCQAFRHGPHLGFLFHLEMDDTIVRALVEEDLASGYVDDETARRVLDAMPADGPPMRTIGRQVFRRWADSIATGHLRA